LTRAKPERQESDEAAESAQARIAAVHHGILYSLADPDRPFPSIPEADKPQPLTLIQILSKFRETDSSVIPLGLDPSSSLPKSRRFLPALLTSALIHSALAFFLLSTPFAAFWSWLLGPPPRKMSDHTDLISYDFRHLTLPNYLPVTNPQGKAPGRGEKPWTHPRLGSSHFDPRITIISDPPHPDNFRLTLKNENAPPDPAPPKDLKIPDLISGGPGPNPAAAKSPTPPPENSKAEKPAQVPPPPLKLVEALKVAPPVTPPVPSTPAPSPPPLMLAASLPDIPTPHLEVPSPPLPIKDTAQSPPAAAPAPPQTAPPRTTHPAATEASAVPPAPGRKSETAAAVDKLKAGGGPQIMALSVDPVSLKDVSAIAGGVHAGAFSISPTGTVQGAPGGAPGGSPDVGKGGHGPAGDKSVAAGNGTGTPGGGGLAGSAATSSATPVIGISGHAGGEEISAGTLPPLKPEDLVYAVKADTPKARAPSMVVSSGSFGGGGLRIYGVLHGDKIYTIFFSMPGKNWILQYCARENSAQVDEASRTVQIHIQPPLAPPAAIEQFDFYRPPQHDAAGSMIILHGIIHEDGLVSDLSTLQGVDAVSNAAASSAFSRWKFTPALRAGKPVALEILVGIP